MESLALLLLNTERETPDPLSTADGAARWWARVQRVAEPPQVLTHGKPRFDTALLDRLVALRAAIASAFGPEGDYEALNAVLGTASVRIALIAGTPALTYAGEDASDAVVLPIAAAALDIVLSGQLDRVRTCAHDPCSRRFLDATKNGSRRWCSLACMERARAPRRRLSAYRPYCAEPSSISGL
jgi:predicted RNA-binding Zn ribbon-like protein